MPSQGTALNKLIDPHRKSFDFVELEPRLEQRGAGQVLMRLLIKYPPGAEPPEDERRWRACRAELTQLDLPPEQLLRLQQATERILTDETIERLIAEHNNAENEADEEPDDKRG